VTHVCNPSYRQREKDLELEASLGKRKLETLSQKTTNKEEQQTNKQTKNRARSIAEFAQLTQVPGFNPQYSHLTLRKKKKIKKIIVKFYSVPTLKLFEFKIMNT
jgi:hypothetical protein